ncbi:MAG: Coenzyme F420 hydrogenase/dehydrogenase, beta subunit C-terminal domain [Promethearchaeota archaeon]
MEYKIMIFSSIGYTYNESDYPLMKKFKGVNSVKITKMGNLGSLDITELLKTIYQGFDGIFVIIDGKIERNKLVSKFDFFFKSAEETNHILERRGLSNQRIKTFIFNRSNHKKLSEAFEKFFRRLIQIGPNPINNGINRVYIKPDYNYSFDSIPIKKLLYATYEASFNYHYRSLFKAKEKILELGKYKEDRLNLLISSIFDAETARKYILGELKRYEPLTLDEILAIFDFSETSIIRDIFYLIEQGYIEEIFTEIPEKKITDQTKLLKLKEPFYRYKVIQNLDNYKQNYFKSVSSVQEYSICCHCGLCTAICPINCIELTQNYLYIDEGECINCGLCYSVCPQSFSIDNLQKFIRKSDTSLKYSNLLGYYKYIASAKTLKYGIKKVGQDGGIVTSLLYYLLSKNLVDAVVTIRHSKKFWKPEVSIIENLMDLYKTAGSTYVHAPMLSVLDKIDKYKNIAIVALPCKIKAIFKGELFPAKLPILSNIKYKIGLFCRESFPYEKILKLFSDKFSVNINEIVKMDITSGKFVLTLESGEIFSYPLKDCDLYGYDFCNYCSDFTAELADISVGSIGSEIGWSSVILRTKKGEKIFNGAIKDGLIEVKSFRDKKPLQTKIEKLAEIKRNSTRHFELNIINT